MPGSPRKRARQVAEMLRAGETPPAPKGWRPARGVSNRKQREAAAAAAAKPSEVAPSTTDLEVLLGGIRADELDDETNAQFQELRKLAFAFAKDVLELPLNPGDKNFNRILSAKQAIATALLTATVRVRPGDLRDRDDDGVESLLDRVKAAEGERVVTAEDLLS